MSMRTVPVHAQKGYHVYLEAGLLERCAAVFKQDVGLCRVAVVTDSNVQKRYLNPLCTVLESAGFSVCSYAFAAGEQSKTMSTLSDLLEFLAQNQLTRSDCIVALGGGVTGDIAGFAAGCYLRGIRFVQVPTTLLAAVDSSVGGKTAVDLKAGKNLAGLFLQPSAVLCDTTLLDTLPPEVFADGAAEAIKTGVLCGEPLFSMLEAGDIRSCLPEIIAQCVAYKGKVVEEDEFDTGLRQTLNLGHTVGHAIELCSGYTVSHGHAVAAGLAIIARAAERLGYWEEPCAARIETTLLRHELPVTTSYSAQQLAEAALSDKKRSGGMIQLVIPRRIGKCELMSVPVDELAAIFAAGMEEGPCR